MTNQKVRKIFYVIGAGKGYRQISECPNIKLLSIGAYYFMDQDEKAFSGDFTFIPAYRWLLYSA